MSNINVQQGWNALGTRSSRRGCESESRDLTSVRDTPPKLVSYLGTQELHGYCVFEISTIATL